MKRADIVTSARGWLGTPYQHQASRRGIGTDCLGLVRGVWRELVGDEPQVVAPYTPDWADLSETDQLLEAARIWLREIPIGSADEGDVLLFRMGAGCAAKHCAIATGPDSLIHAYWGRSVCATRLVPWWRRRIAGAFSFPGLED